jgi:L-rhamnose mutarotase
MKRVGFLLKVKNDPALQAEYKEHHRQVWPEMLDALRRHGWGNYSLFMRADGLMFGHVEVPVTLEKCLQGMAAEDVNTRWQAAMQPFFEVPPGARPDQTMLGLEEVFYMQGAGMRKASAQRLCFQLTVKDDPYSLGEYRRTHSAVWPEMLAALTRHGWSNYSIWMRRLVQPTGAAGGTIYLYSEMSQDPARAEREMAGEEVSRRWGEFMRPLFEAGPDGAPGRRVSMEEVFHTG